MKPTTLETAAHFWIVTALEDTQAGSRGRDHSLPDQLLAIAIQHGLTVEYLMEWIGTQGRKKEITATAWRNWCQTHAAKPPTTPETPRHNEPEQGK